MQGDRGNILRLEAEYTFLATCKWRLFVNNVTIVRDMLVSAFTEASWVGYAAVVCGSLAAATIVGTRAQTTPITPPTWSNGDVSDKTYYGWYLTTSDGSDWIAAINLGAQTLAAGTSRMLVPTLTNKQE